MWQTWEMNTQFCSENLGEEGYLNKAWLKN